MRNVIANLTPKKIFSSRVTFQYFIVFSFLRISPTSNVCHYEDSLAGVKWEYGLNKVTVTWPHDEAFQRMVSRNKEGSYPDEDSKTFDDVGGSRDHRPLEIIVLQENASLMIHLNESYKWETYFMLDWDMFIQIDTDNNNNNMDLVINTAALLMLGALPIPLMTTNETGTISGLQFSLEIGRDLFETGRGYAILKLNETSQHDFRHVTSWLKVIVKGHRCTDDSSSSLTATSSISSSLPVASHSTRSPMFLAFPSLSSPTSSLLNSQHMCSGQGLCADDSQEAYFRCFCCSGRNGSFCQAEGKGTNGRSNHVVSHVTSHHGNATTHDDDVSFDRTTETLRILMKVKVNSSEGMSPALNGSHLPSSSELQHRSGHCIRNCSNKEVNLWHECSDWMDCKNGGTCIDLIGSSTNYCQCPPGFTGSDCSLKFDLCKSKPCPHICLDYGTFYECECYSGYEGRDCSVNLDECLSSPCHNGGTCVDLVNMYSCLCAEGYTGSHCQHGFHFPSDYSNNMDSFLLHHPTDSDSFFVTSFKHPKFNSLISVLITLFGSLTLTGIVFFFCYCSTTHPSCEQVENTLNKRHKKKVYFQNLRTKIQNITKSLSKPTKGPKFSSCHDCEEGDSSTLWRQMGSNSSKNVADHIRKFLKGKRKMFAIKGDKHHFLKVVHPRASREQRTCYFNRGLQLSDGSSVY